MAKEDGEQSKRSVNLLLFIFTNLKKYKRNGDVFFFVAGCFNVLRSVLFCFQLIIAVRKQSCGKVMFLQACVILSRGSAFPQCHGAGRPLSIDRPPIPQSSFPVITQS